MCKAQPTAQRDTLLSINKSDIPRPDGCTCRIWMRSMEVRLSEDFLSDLSGLNAGLARKCGTILRTAERQDARTMKTEANPGWRVHPLKSSPFKSISVDMNYRMLCTIEGERFCAFRVVKHDLADASRINRNGNLESWPETGAVPPRGQNTGEATLFDAGQCWRLKSFGPTPGSVGSGPVVRGVTWTRTTFYGELASLRRQLDQRI